MVVYKDSENEIFFLVTTFNSVSCVCVFACVRKYISIYFSLKNNTEIEFNTTNNKCTKIILNTQNKF